MNKNRLILIMDIVIIGVIILFSTISSSATDLNLRASLTQETNFNIWADAEQTVQTTYDNQGYETFLKVGTTEYESHNGTVTGDLVTCTTQLSYISENRYIKITYQVKNDATTPKTIGVATCADIKIGEVDRAAITNLEGGRGFIMTDGTNMFSFLGRNTYAVTNVDTYWFGKYDQRRSEMWTDTSSSEGISDVDSGMAFSWKNRIVEPNETLSFSALIGIGSLNTPPTITVDTQLNSQYYQKDSLTFGGIVKDDDVNDIISIKYSVDGGEEQMIGDHYQSKGVDIEYKTTFQLATDITQGEHYIEVWAVDDKSNMSQAMKFYFTIERDDIAPKAEHTLSVNQWTNEDVTIQLEVTDTQSGVKQITQPDGTVVETSNTAYVVKENGSYTFLLEDQVGNTREYEITIDNIDSQEPTLTVDPQQSSWSKSIAIALSFSDEGGSGFKSYQYAVTNTTDSPSSYCAEITKATDQIMLQDTGNKYLHVIAKDNAGNVTKNNVFGLYQIDCTKPELTIDGDFITPVRDKLIVSLVAEDKDSGMAKMTVNGNEIPLVTNASIEITKNGSYTIVAEDQVGNTKVETIEVNNVYRNCEAGLEHTTYSSSYDACPICALIHGSEVNQEHEIYNAQPKQVTYHNPQGATIVEYYNGNTQKPTQVGTYSYNLKVIYEGIEYNTGITGKFNIRKKEITIENIKPQNKSYDGTNHIVLTGGNLVGIEQSDQVEFLLPSFGMTSSKDIGQYDVTVPEIVLTGDKARNYQLRQPTKETLQAIISPRPITITQLQAEARPYNGKAEVEITAGKLNDLLENNVDNIGFKLKGGIARSNLVGQQIVDINTIELTNNTKGNYRLIAPDPIMVQITRKEITIENIQAEDRTYDGTQIVAIQGGNLLGIETGDDVAFMLPPTGMISEKNIGEYDVTIPEIILTGEKATNYQLIPPDPKAVKVNILPRQVTITELQANTRPYNRNTEVELTAGKLNNLLQDNIDDIGFELKGGIARNDLVGEQIVDVNTIELTNNTAGNYELIPPDPITVQITPKDIIIENIQAENRPYDGSDIVAIQGGNLIGIETGDEVGFNLPQVGIISNKNIGEYYVTIPEIILTGERANNYQLIHPAEETVKVTIFQRELTINALQGKDRKYDKTDIVEIEGGKLQNIVGKEEVTALIPKTGVIPDCDIGIWPVEIDTIVIQGRDSANYVLLQPQAEDILVEILEPSQPNLQLATFIHKINDKEVENKAVDVAMLEINNIEKRQQEEIRFADQLEITIRVYNTGEGNGYAQKITNIIPKGMKFVAEDETNQKNEWKQINRNTVETEKLNFAGGVENEIEKLSEEQIDYRDISLVLEVVEEKEIGTIENQTTIEQVDIREKTIDYDVRENETILPITISYTDFTIKNTIQEIIEIKKDNEIKHQVSQGNQQFSKIEIDAKEVNATQLKIIYYISITNQGNAKAKVDRVVSSLPTGLQCSLQDNPEWKNGMDNLLICEGFGEIGAKETKTKKLVLYGEALPMIGSRTSEVILFSSQDIDQRKMEQKNQESLTISNVNQEIVKTNNVSKAELIFSIRTGIKVSDWFWLVLVGFLIIGGIVVSFKRKS